MAGRLIFIFTKRCSITAYSAPKYLFPLVRRYVTVIITRRNDTRSRMKQEILQQHFIFHLLLSTIIRFLFLARSIVKSEPRALEEFTILSPASVAP